MVDYFCKDIHNIRDAFYLEVSVIDEQPLSEEIISLSCRVDLKNEMYAWQMRVHFTLALQSEGWRIKSICLLDTRSDQEEQLHIYNNIPGAVFCCRFDDSFSVIERMTAFLNFWDTPERSSPPWAIRCLLLSTGRPGSHDGETEGAVKVRTIPYITKTGWSARDGSIKWISIKAQLFTEKSGEQYFYCCFCGCH